MNHESWYDVVRDRTLVQGDLMPGCPVSEISGNWELPLKADAVEVNFTATDLIVMTQSCDLETNKVRDVLTAKVMAWREVTRQESERGNTAVKSRDFRKKLIDGAIPGLSLLHRHEADPKLEWSVVDFHRLYTLPKSFLEQYAKTVGPRLRLRSPYREHLAQAFARYFMRVGLPHDAKAFEKEGDIAVTP